MGDVTLREIDEHNRAEVEELRVSAAQQRFVDGVAPSLREATEYSPGPWIRAIYAGDTPVGFLMLADNHPSSPWPYFLWRFLIDERHQGHGYGRAALDLLVAHVRTRPAAESLHTSVATYDDPELDAASPMGFYLGYGFRPTGEYEQREAVLRLDLQ